MRIAVLGTGGVGGYFGGRLAAAGHDVTFMARGAHLEAIRANGLVVTSVLGDFTVQPAKATDDITSIGQVDVVLLAVKTWQLPPVLAALPGLIGPDTAVVTTRLFDSAEKIAQKAGDSFVTVERLLLALAMDASSDVAAWRLSFLNSFSGNIGSRTT